MRKHNGNLDSSRYWLYGIHAVHAALKNTQRQQLRLLIKDTGMINDHLLTYIKIKPEIIDKNSFDKILGYDIVHQGIALQTMALPAFALEDIIISSNDTSLLVILDGITDPHNTGAIIRSAAAFGAHAVVVTTHNSSAYNSGITAKTASGALELIPIIEVTNLARAMDLLKKNNFWLYGLDESGQQTLGHIQLNHRVALVFGAEGCGLRRLTREYCDDLIQLPTSTAFSTLNVSVSTAVALYEWHRQNILLTR